MTRNTKLTACIIGVLLSMAPFRESHAAIPIAKIIQEAIIKVIKATDLMVQRLQNKTIWLQNVQKVLENKLNELKLKEIAEWTEKHRALYKEYYDELWKVRNTLASYQRIRMILERQAALVEQYKHSWNLVRQDKHFTADEIDYMYRVYSGILNSSVRNLDQLLLIINSFKVQMTDAERLAQIERCGDAIDQNYFDLMLFNQENMRLSVSRAKDAHEIESIKKMYGLPIQ
jgi:hypothetical protein